MTLTTGNFENETEAVAPSSPAKRRRYRPWLILLSLLVVAFLIDVLPPYLTLDPEQSRIVLQQDVAAHYPLLLAHIAFGSIALLALCFQFWPWIRRNHPAIHRNLGRVYVFGGALPSALTALAIMPLTAGWSANLGITFHAVLWFITAGLGWRAARQRRFADHRRWMIYGAALALGILWGRSTVHLYTVLPSKFDVGYVFEMARWGGWMINLLVAQWWLDRTARRRQEAVV